MSVLLDTQALLWLLADSPRFGPRARALINSTDRVYYSAASIWEIEIKRALGKLRIDADLAESLQAAGVRELPVTAGHALATSAVELPHRDPFDRMLLAQAEVEGMTFLTADGVLLGLSSRKVVDVDA